jgi:N-methylhydantoinase A
VADHAFGGGHGYAVSRLAADFEALYERKFGQGSAYRAAGMEMTMFRLSARGLVERPRVETAPLSGADPGQALIGRRDIFVEAAGSLAPANIYDFERLLPGNVIAGPAVIHTPITTIVVQSGQTGRIDAYRNTVIERD